jgi:hypothetical protein
VNARYVVRSDDSNRYGMTFCHIVDTRTGAVCATWMVPSYAREHCAWLNRRERGEVA